MSLPYDLYVSLFLESLILDLSLLSNDLYDSGMAYVANEEWEVERRVVRTIISDNTASLQPNFGQPITIRGHSITIGCHDERGSNHGVWEWHGHVITYEEMNGYSLEYIHEYYFERNARETWMKESGSCGDPTRGFTCVVCSDRTVCKFHCNNHLMKILHFRHTEPVY